MKTHTKARRAVRRWLLRTLQPCQEMVPLMSESLERRLGLLEQLKLRLHLLVCAWCARYLKQIEFLRRIAGQTPTTVNDHASPLALNAEARRRISESLRKFHVRN